MDLGRPHRLIASPLDGSVLSVLSGTTRPLTGREVARLAPEGSQPGIWKALVRLTDQGLIHREDIGNASLYTLNRDHLAAPAVDILTGLRSRLLSRLRAAIDGWSVAPLHASLFGSAARREGDAHSDIDIFLVRSGGVNADDEQWGEQVERLSEDVRRWTGNPVGISEVSVGDVERLRRDRPAVVEALRSEAITLYGPEAAQLLAVERA